MTMTGTSSEFAFQEETWQKVMFWAMLITCLEYPYFPPLLRYTFVIG